MKSLSFVLKNKKLPFILFIEEMFFFLLVFFVFFAILNKSIGDNFSGGIDPYMLSHIFEKGVVSTLLIAMIPLLALFALLHVFLLSGVFSGLDMPLNRFGDFLSRCAEGFWRFFFLMIIYLIPALIISDLINKMFGRIGEGVFNTVMSMVLLGVKPLVLSVFMIFLSYFHTKSRFSVVKLGRMKIFNSFKSGEFFRFFMYQIFSLLIMALGIFGSMKILDDSSMMWIVLSFLVFQLGIFLRICLQLASYKTLHQEF